MVMQKLNTGLTGKAFKMILLGVLLAAVAGLVLTDVGGFFRGGGVSRSDVARVGKDHVTINEFAPLYRRTLQQSNFDEEAAKKMGLPYMVLQQEINRRLLLQTADKMGIRISNQHVANNLTKQLSQLKMPGTNKEKLDMILQQQGMNEAQLVDALRGDFAIDLLESATKPPHLHVPPMIAEGVYRAKNEKRVVEMVKINLNDADAKNADDAELQAYFEENKDRYRTPEQRDAVFLTLPKTLFSPEIKVADADAETYYNEHKDQFMTPERVRLEQVITQDEAAAQKIAHAKPASLANQKDAQSVATDWYTRTSLPQELADAVFADKKTGLIGPIKSSLGWHVLRIESFEDGTAKEFASVKNDIIQVLRDEKLDEAMNDFSNQLDEQVANGTSLDDLAKEYKTSTKTVTGITSLNVGEKLKAANIEGAQMSQNVFTLNEGETSPLMDLSNGDYMLLQISKVMPSAVPELSTVKAQVAADVAKDNKAKALTTVTENLIGKYDRAKPEVYQQALRDKNLRTQKSEALTREGFEKAYGADVANLVFSLSDKNDLSYTNTADSTTLLRLTSVVRDTSTPDAKALAEQNKALQASMAQEVQQQFMAGWADRIGVTVNETLMREQFLNASQDQ